MSQYECFNGRSNCLLKYFDNPNVVAKAEHYSFAIHLLCINLAHHLKLLMHRLKRTNSTGANYQTR